MIWKCVAITSKSIRNENLIGLFKIILDYEKAA